MTGRSLHDTLLQIVSHGPLRARLFDTHDEALAINSDERRILRRVPREQLCDMARFLARHYYAERIIRLFRHIRRLAAQTGRDPLLILNTPQARTVLDRAVLGSPDTADEMLSLIETFLLKDAAKIQKRFPYWQDLVRYQATMFRLEARRAEGSATCFPCRSASGSIVQFEWDLPAILADLAAMDNQEASSLQCPSLILMAASADKHVTSLRCPPNVRLLFEAADGTRTVEELGIMAGFEVLKTEEILRHMTRIGAIQWKASLTGS